MATQSSTFLNRIAVGKLLKHQTTIHNRTRTPINRVNFTAPVVFCGQRRCFSSKDGDGGHAATSLGSSIAKKRSGPVKIKETARSSAAAKLRSNKGVVMPGSSTVNLTDRSAPRPVIRKKEEEAEKARNRQLSHPAHHFMDGGMPCDPAPPPYSLAEYGEESLYTLILLRHGESEWNVQNRYTGWCDVNLTEAGRQEARTAGRLLYENGIEVDQAFTSVLKRASFSCNMALNSAEQHWVPITKTWRLNERHYGALQGIASWFLVMD